MRQTHVSLKVVVAFALFISFSSAAENEIPPEEKRDAQAWLKKIQSAAQQLSYSGTFVYQQGNQIRTSRITHLLQGRNEVEKLEILDGLPREYIRNNEDVTCYVPEAKTLLVEKRVTQDIFPAILAANGEDISDFYDVRKSGSWRVAGHESQSITLQPKDKLRYGYKLWADKRTGLLLRAQTLDEKNEPVEQISFAQISIGNIDPASVRPGYMNTGGWRVEHALVSHADLSNWTVKGMPRGFKKVREVKRMVSDGGTSSEALPISTKREVSQIVYSDGLAAISIFIEPGTRSRTEGSIRQGAVNIMGKRHGDFWLTIVGEVPLDAIRQVSNSIEYKSN